MKLFKSEKEIKKFDLEKMEVAKFEKTENKAVIINKILKF